MSGLDGKVGGRGEMGEVVGEVGAGGGTVVVEGGGEVVGNPRGGRGGWQVGRGWGRGVRRGEAWPGRKVKEGNRGDGREVVIARVEVAARAAP